MNPSLYDFFDDVELDKRINPANLEGSSRDGLGEFIAIYDGDERYSRNTVVSSDLVKNYGVDRFDWITFDSRSGVVYALFFTEECRRDKGISKKKSISLHDKHKHGKEQAFHGDVPLRNFDLNPPVRFAIRNNSYTGDNSLILALHRVPFIPFQHISVQVGDGYYSEV